MRVLDILSGTTVDGPGLRTSIYFAGCPHHCPGCHNPQSWNIGGGVEMSVDEIAAKAISEELPVTFSGGDPLLQHQELKHLASILKEQAINIWCYTGYQFEDILQNRQLLDTVALMDVLVDGPFIQNLRNKSLRFKGSENQRLIDIPRTLASGKVVLWTDDE